MSFDRTDRIAGEMKREISAILRDSKDPRLQGMISVLSVRLSRDLSYAKVIVSVLGSDEERNDAKKALKSAASFIRRELSARVDMRITPELSFEVSDAIEHEIRISKMIDDALKGTKNE